MAVQTAYQMGPLGEMDEMTIEKLRIGLVQIVHPGDMTHRHLQNAVKSV